MLLFTAGLPLPAQITEVFIGPAAANMPGSTVYIPPIIGTGNRPTDNLYFADLINRELGRRNYTIMQTQLNAALYLTGTIYSYAMPTDDQDVLTHIASNMYVLNLILQNSATGEILVQQNLFYSDAEEMDDMIILAFDNIPLAPGDTAVVIAEEKDPYAWQEMPWYFGAGFYWAPRVYVGETPALLYANFSLGLLMEYRFKNDLSLVTGLNFLPDWIAATDVMGINYRDIIMEVPFLFQYSFKPPGMTILSPYLGIGVNFSLLGQTVPPLLGGKIGFLYGFKVGRQGILAIDASAAMDFSRAKLSEDWARSITYQRILFQLGAVYKYGTEKFPWFRRRAADNNTMGTEE